MDYTYNFCGLYYKHLIITNDDSSTINKLRASVTGNARVVIYDCHMFIVQSTGKSVTPCV